MQKQLAGGEMTEDIPVSALAQLAQAEAYLKAAGLDPAVLSALDSGGKEAKRKKKKHKKEKKDKG
jgi:hypothetical protein